LVFLGPVLGFNPFILGEGKAFNPRKVSFKKGRLKEGFSSKVKVPPRVGTLGNFGRRPEPFI